jgi:hypothetical protein
MSPEMDNYRIPRQRQPRTRVSAEENFARLLEVESLAAARSGADANLGRLLTVAGALRITGTAVAPAPLAATTKAAMRQRLVAVAIVSSYDSVETAAASRLGQPRRGSVTTRLHRRLVTLAGSFAVVTSIAGVGVAAAHSLPGDPFYGVKRATEAVQLWATQGDAAKGRLHLEFARTRLAEAEKLPADSSHLASTLAAMDSQTKQGTSELIAAYKLSHSTAPLATLVTFTQEQYAGLATLSQRLPANLHGSEATALSVLTSVTGNVRSVSGPNCLSCLVSGGTAPGGSPATKPHRTSPPASSPTPTPQRSSSPAPSGSQPAPTRTPSSLLPTGLVPTNLLPTNLPSSLLPSLLSTNHKHKKKGLLTPLLNSLGL